MANPYFSFKQFTVFHDKCAMKVGVDGVLLGAWATADCAASTLDVGTGTGLVALMLAQRSNNIVTAIDIDAGAVLQAKENVSNSPWAERIQVTKISLQEFAKTSKTTFDLIISNPPYFVNSTKTPAENRTTARHTDSLTHHELIDNAKLLLNPTGRICIILPVKEGLLCIQHALKAGLFNSKKVLVFPKPDAPAKRLLLEFCLLPALTVESELVIEGNERHQYSSEFTELAKDFYLKL